MHGIGVNDHPNSKSLGLVSAARRFGGSSLYRRVDHRFREIRNDDYSYLSVTFSTENH